MLRVRVRVSYMAILTIETYEENIVPNKYDKRKNKESLATRVCI